MSDQQQMTNFCPNCEGMAREANAIKADASRTLSDLCNYAWQAVYGEGCTDWEYPAQAIRHLVDYAG